MLHNISAEGINGSVICFIASVAMALAISSGNAAAAVRSRSHYERKVSGFIHITMRCIAITAYFLHHEGAINDVTTSLCPKRWQQKDIENELSNT
jgi:hypothetical protein